MNLMGAAAVRPLVPLTVDGCVTRLRAAAEPGARASMARYGIASDRALGVRVPRIRALAKEAGRDHALALALWRTGIHEARILASMVDEPARVTRAQMDRWARQFDSWDVCDQCCMNLFDRTPHARAMAVEWMTREREFEKRAGFALVASLASHDKDAPDGDFLKLLDAVARHADDPRNFVKKAASWAMRSVGKRNAALRKAALAHAKRLAASPGAGARWVGKDAIRELASR